MIFNPSEEPNLRHLWSKTQESNNNLVLFGDKSEGEDESLPMKPFLFPQRRWDSYLYYYYLGCFSCVFTHNSLPTLITNYLMRPISLFCVLWWYLWWIGKLKKSSSIFSNEFSSELWASFCVGNIKEAEEFISGESIVFTQTLQWGRERERQKRQGNPSQRL